MAISEPVAKLVQLVQTGSRWERSPVDGKPAIRITDPDGGTQTTVLTGEQEAEFLAAVGGSVRISLPPKK